MGNCLCNNNDINSNNENSQNQIINNINHSYANAENPLNTSNNNSIINYIKMNNSNNINNNLNNGVQNELLNNNTTKINSFIKGYLFRKKYKEYIKLDLMDFANELYFQFLAKSKNKKVAKILNNNNNGKVLGYLRADWSEFYENDPNQEINIKLKKIKKYVNGMIFEYKSKNLILDTIEKCLSNSLSCYKGSIDIYTSKKCGHGELIYADGSQKLGTFYNNEFTGWNTYIDPEGTLYVGFFQGDKLNGKGLKYVLEKDHIYKGDFVNFMRHGYGKDYRATSKYEGQFINEKKNGQGKIELKTGDIYIGEFKNNTISGVGKYIWKNGKHEYEGNFLNGKFHGEGLYRWGNNQYFKGSYVNGVKQGKGEIGYNNGKKCVINFKNGKPDGKGILIEDSEDETEIEFEKGTLINSKKLNKN